MHESFTNKRAKIIESRKEMLQTKNPSLRSFSSGYFTRVSVKQLN